MGLVTNQMDEFWVEKLSALSMLLFVAVTMWRVPITGQFFEKEECEKLHQNYCTRKGKKL